MDALVDVGEDRTRRFDVDFEERISLAAGAELARFAGELLEVGIGIKGGPLEIHGPHQRRVVGVNRRLFEERGAGGEKGHQYKGPQPPGLHQVADEGVVLALPDPVCSEQIGDLADRIAMHEIRRVSTEGHAPQIDQRGPAICPVAGGQPIKLLKLMAEPAADRTGVERAVVGSGHIGPADGLEPGIVAGEPQRLQMIPHMPIPFSAFREIDIVSLV